MEENNNPNPTLTEAAASQPVSSNQSMPSIRQLLEESWRLFTKKLFKIILIMLFVFLATFISFFIAGLVVIFTGLVLPEASGVSVQNLPSILSSSPLFLTVAGIAFVSAIVITVIVSLMSQASLILALSEKDETVSAFRLFKKRMAVCPAFVYSWNNRIFDYIRKYFSFHYSGNYCQYFPGIYHLCDRVGE